VTSGSPRWYTIGFVAPERPLARSLGSGTLVSFGTLHGILTARHVVDEMHKQKEGGRLNEIGLVQSTMRDAQLQGIRFPSDFINDVTIGHEPDDEFGPDLAFIRLPDQTAAALMANCSFLNFHNEAELLKSPAPDGTKQRDFIFGIVAEWDTDEPDPSKGLDMGLISVQMNEGNVNEIAARDGYDRLEFSPLHDQEFQALPNQNVFPPKSYGGTSGGGLWRLAVETMADGKERLVQSRLLGLPYFEKEVNGWLTIICHGPDSIYRRLPETIRSRW
jgi:hypothetical protein